MRKVTIILVRRDNEGTKAGAFKTDMAGLLNNHHPGTPGQQGMKAGAFKTDMTGLSNKSPSRYAGTTKE